MDKFKFFLLAFVAMSIVACSDSESDIYDDEEYEDVLLTDSVDSSAEFSLMRGLAADGASSITFLIPVKKSNSDPTITIEPMDEEWGEVNYLGRSQYETTNFAFYSYSLTADEELPAALENADVAELEYFIEVSDGDGNAMGVTVSVSVIRPAVIFVHGLASNSATFDPMLGYIRPLGLYLDEALYSVDYFASSVASYSTNLNVVPEAIEHVRSTLYDMGYVNDKFTLVGHSMGGILTRLYIQNESEEYPYSDDILKIITVDTPHSGSQVADFALTLDDNNPDGPLSIFSKMGAIVDLSVASEATANLNDSEKLAAANDLAIPTHIVAAHIGTVLDVAQLIKEEQYLFAAITYILNVIEQKFIYGDDESDFMVPMSSQLGGVEDSWRSSYITTYSNEWHCSVHTTEQAASDFVELFNTLSSDDSIFTTDGFDPPLLSYSSTSDVVLLEVSSRPSISEVVSQFIVGIDADGDIVAAAYDDEGDSDFALDAELATDVVSELYIARLESGEVQYQLTE